MALYFIFFFKFCQLWRPIFDFYSNMIKLYQKVCLLSRISKQNLYSVSRYTALQTDVYIFYSFFFKFLYFVMTSQGNHDNLCLLSMIFLFLLLGATKFEVFSISLLSRGIRIYDVVTTNIYISPPIIRISVFRNRLDAMNNVM